MFGGTLLKPVTFNCCGPTGTVQFKNSVRIIGLNEENGEDTQWLIIDTFQKEVDVQIVASEIDIVHRMG